MENGSRIGRWTVLQEVKKGKYRYYKCRCDCGNEKEIYYRTLETGRSQSCGCLRQERTKSRARDLTGMRFWRLEVLQRDPERAGYWLCRCDCGRETSVRAEHLSGSNSATKSCGCLSAELSSARGAESIGKNAEEQMAINRALKTNIQVIKTKTPPVNNKSGCKGVRWDESRQRWAAYITVHGKRKYLGRYTSLENAKKARQNAEEEFFAPLLEQARQLTEEKSAARQKL